MLSITDLFKSLIISMRNSNNNALANTTNKTDLLTCLTYILVQVTFHPNYGAYGDIHNIAKPLVPCILSITCTITIIMLFQVLWSASSYLFSFQRQ